MNIGRDQKKARLTAWLQHWLTVGHNEKELRRLAKLLASKLKTVYNIGMNKSQFNILTSRMKTSPLRYAVLAVMIDSVRQCDAARLYGISRQSLYQSIKRLKKRAAEFEAMGKLKL